MKYKLGEQESKRTMWLGMVATGWPDYSRTEYIGVSTDQFKSELREQCQIHRKKTIQARGCSEDNVLVFLQEVPILDWKGEHNADKNTQATGS